MYFIKLLYSEMFRTLLFIPIFNLMIALYKVFGNNLGFAIVAMALISRGISYPLLAKQMKSSEKMQQLKPKLDKIKQKYKNDKQKLNEAQLELYKDMGVNPVGGCLPMIVQLIFLIQVRNVVVALVNDGFGAFNEIAYFEFLKFSENASVNLNFFGMNLNKVAADFAWNDTQIIPYVVLALLVGLTQLVSTKMLMPQMSGGNKSSKNSGQKKQKKESDNDSFESMSQTMNTQMTYLMPALTTFMSLGFSGGSSFFSAALSLFWTVQNLFVIIQKIVINPQSRANFITNSSRFLDKLTFGKFKNGR